MAGIAVKMRRALWAGLFGLSLAAPASADVAEALNDMVGPAYAALADSAAALDATAQADCTPEALRPAFNALWDEWARIGFLRLGPVEEYGRVLAMHFWPDKKGSGRRAQQALIDGDGAALDDPEAFAGLSVALRGLAGLERLIYPSKLTGDEARLCALRRATTADLARMAAEIRDEWPNFAPLLTHPGGANNTLFLNEDEARQALFTQIVTGLDYLVETRLGRPMGSFERPRPERAESVLSGRGLRNVTQALMGLRDMTLAFAPDSPVSAAAYARALTLAADLDDPALAGVATPAGRLKVEILAQAIHKTREAVVAEIGGALGLSVGFNAQDGD